MGVGEAIIASAIIGAVSAKKAADAQAKAQRDAQKAAEKAQKEAEQKADAIRAEQEAKAEAQAQELAARAAQDAQNAAVTGEKADFEFGSSDADTTGSYTDFLVPKKSTSLGTSSSGSGLGV